MTGFCHRKSSHLLHLAPSSILTCMKFSATSLFSLLHYRSRCLSYVFQTLQPNKPHTHTKCVQNAQTYPSCISSWHASPPQGSPSVVDIVIFHLQDHVFSTPAFPSSHRLLFPACILPSPHLAASSRSECQNLFPMDTDCKSHKPRARSRM